MLLPPGTYDLEVTAAGYLGQNVSVTLDRAGANRTVGLIPRVVVSSPLYGVSFHEDGLLPNISWSVTLQGTGNGVRSLEVTDSSGDEVVSFTETNGTYGYFVSPVSGYSSSPATGDFLIAGADLSVSVDFQPIAPPPVIEGFSANPSGEIDARECLRALGPGLRRSEPPFLSVPLVSPRVCIDERFDPLLSA